MALGWVASLAAAATSCADDHAHPFHPADKDAGIVPPGPCPDKVIGFATADGGTTGGGDGAPVVASTLQELKDLAAQDGPLVISISGTIDLTGQVEIESDKTVMGAPGASLAGGGLIIKDKQNVIVRNLKITQPIGPSGSIDAITIQHSSHVWIDHCDLSSDLVQPKGTYDGLIDITHAATDITVSWTLFHDHYNTSLVGHSVDNAAEDNGYLTVTFHHNRFNNVIFGSPRVRFGTVHLFSNHYLDIGGYSGSYAIASQMGATLLIEGNAFDQVEIPIRTKYEDPTDGTVRAVSNVYDPAASETANVITTPKNSWQPAYDYMLDSTDSVRAIVELCAGVDKVP